MTLTKRLTPALMALVFMPLAAPAMANDGGAPALVTGYRPAARAATPREQLAVPTTMSPPGTSLLELLSDHPPASIPIPVLTARWATSIPAANRKLGNCLELTTVWDEGQGRVSGTLKNRCYLSIRIRASYGFQTGTGPCAAIDRMDGVMMPAFGRRGIRWQGPEDRTQTACLNAIDVLGVPAWTTKQAQAASGWLAERVRGGFLSEMSVWDKDGNTKAQGSGTGKVNTATTDQPCVLTLSSPDFGQWDGPKTARQFPIHWVDVAAVQDASYNQFFSLVFKDSIGHEAWALNFSDDFSTMLAASNLDPTVAASILSEYCRAAEKL